MHHPDAQFADDPHDEAAAIVRSYELAEATHCAQCGQPLGTARFDADSDGILGECCARRLAAFAVAALLDGVIGRAHYSRRAVEAILRGDSGVDPESYDVAASGRACAAYTAELVEATSRVRA